MTYLEFYQAWADLVMPDSQFLMEAPNTIDCTYPSSVSSYLVLPLVLIGITVFFLWFSYLWMSRKKPKKGTWITLIIYILLLIVVTKFNSSDSDSYYKLECKYIYNTVEELKDYNTFEESSIKYPDKDYTVEEFEKNLVILSPDASPKQIELAKTVFENCLKNLPSDYQVNHSSIVRRCITNVDTETIFRSKDVEIYKNNSIKKLRNIH